MADQQAVLLKLYNDVQHHASLEDFLQHHLSQSGLQGGLLLQVDSFFCCIKQFGMHYVSILQVTTHSHLLSGEEVEQLGDVLGYRDHVSWFLLQEFDTELDFFNKVRFVKHLKAIVFLCTIYQIGLRLSYSPAFQRDQVGSQDSLLIIQCDSGDSDGDLIACARYRIYDEGVKSMKQNSILECKGNTHVLFVIHLPQQSVGSSFVGFQGDPWVSAHIDDLRRMNSDTVTLSEAMNMPISHLFISPDSDDSELEGSHESKQPFMATKESLAEVEVEEMQADETMDDNIEASDPRVHGSDMEHHVPPPEEPIPPPINQIGQQPMEETPTLESFIDQMTLDIEESMEQGQASEKPDEEMLHHLSEPENLEHVREQAEPMMDSSIAEQPQLETFDQQLAQPYFQPKPKTLKKSGYYLRLHGCIQAAASRLQDSAKNKERATDRVKLLVELIPRSPAVNLGRLNQSINKVAVQ